MAASPTFELEPACPRSMTRCECSGTRFQDIARLMRDARLTQAQACDLTGCGRTCGACLPDLAALLRARGLS